MYWHQSNPHLGTLGLAQSSANAINNGGQVVGWAQTLEEVSDYATHATSWSGAKTTVLGAPGWLSSAEDINVLWTLAFP